MPDKAASSDGVVDLFIIGGGINGCGIARDAAGRGLSVTLAEKDDLARWTSSASTKLFHGGLRYLEYFEVRLVREALIERERLLRAMPHISWPMRFVLPLHKDMRFENDTPTSRLLSRVMPWLKGRRPDWLIRLGLFMYDSLGGRKLLPGTRRVDLFEDVAGDALQTKYERAFEYSDCWVQDSRLVVLNARDAQARGATILPRTKVVDAHREGDHWVIAVEDVNGQSTYRARMLVNAGGPWVGQLLDKRIGVESREGVRLVRGSHIVTRKLFDHDKSYFFQGSDGRIIFAIPYEEDFTLIGTTDADHENADEPPQCTDEEAQYLCNFASQYFRVPVTLSDIVWRYSGVRPLYDDGASSATAATRDYVLTVEASGPPLLNVFGGKITTYRRLAESALEKIGAHLPLAKGDWTCEVPLPGGDFPVEETQARIDALRAEYPFLSPEWARRMFRNYGLEAAEILGTAQSREDLGRDFGADLTEAEVCWLMKTEWAREADDILWRRTKLGLRLDDIQVKTLEAWIAEEAR